MKDLFFAPTVVELERRKRIRLTMAAYGYEFENHSFMSDAEFDKLALSIDPTIKTGNEALDAFFAKEFQPDTGMWIRKHPDLEAVKRCFKRYYS